MALAKPAGLSSSCSTRYHPALAPPALAKTVAELTFGSDATLRQRVLEDLMREIAQFEAEFANAPASDMRH
ncbi:MAG: hypothetical protein WBW99_03190 [Pseudolabrys sp.]